MQRWLGSVLLLAACGGGTSAPNSAQPAGSASGAVRSFMQAVADSNLDKMASLWGTAEWPGREDEHPTRLPPQDRRHAGLSSEPVVPHYL